MLDRTAPLLVAFLVLVLAVPAGAADEPGVPDKALQKKIDEAIEKGAEYLRKVQKQSGMIGAIHAQKTTHYEIGTTALGGLALLAAGNRKGDACVDNVLEYCKKKDLVRGQSGGRTTYDTSTLIMFAIEYYREPPKVDSKKKKDRTREAKKNRENPCSLPPDAKAWIRDMALWLSGKQKDTGGWGYPQHREDFSNTQYALLGLRAARDCGVPIAPGVFLNAMQRALDMQEKDGPKVPRIEKTPDGREYVIKSNDRARGWGYYEQNPNPTGSMTTAGIAILAIANDALLEPRRFGPYKPSKQAEVGQAVQDGFAWLDVNWTLTQNPGSGAPNWHFYYLYGLERAAIYGARTLIGEHDWYVDGAKYLVGEQREDGRWSTGSLGTAEYEASDVLDTAWAILFLKKATRPLQPIGPPVTGD